MKTFIHALLLTGAFAISTGALTSNALALDKPAGDTILTITGHVTKTNSSKAATFDMAMLEKLDGRKATMETPWTTGKTEFSGPYLRAVLAAAGASGKKLIVKALNDYASEVPFEDAEKLDTILAVRMNGDEMSVREKGPVFLIYPFDKDHSLYNEKYFSRSVWQIKEIEVVE
ncbi:molybdopterin-dependent oxidoreductase [Rhizobium sp. C4]|uniref:molybdopterin-dependent oxidoreductase n=1 Tax=Rhizobium sp. C4 TaxID=1349800 RepID=UPI001E420A3D|nr:molybdopterin-dependent oxidoreductase [Rhizobium sp. C4]MCD2174482.1 molybdopterin-dependent oxidoreductase [Rhizobium sp. C4]